MGLTTSHGCFNGTYSSFLSWRAFICEAAGYGDINKRKGFGGDLEWPDDDPLVELLVHSDRDGRISFRNCGLIADRPEEIIKTAIPGYENEPQYTPGWITLNWIKGLGLSASKEADVLF